MFLRWSDCLWLLSIRFLVLNNGLWQQSDDLWLPSSGLWLTEWRGAAFQSFQVTFQMFYPFSRLWKQFSCVLIGWCFLATGQWSVVFGCCPKVSTSQCSLVAVQWCLLTCGFWMLFSGLWTLFSGFCWSVFSRCCSMVYSGHWSLDAVQ